MKSPSVALITVTYNSAEVIRRHWGGAAALDVPWIVADNASSDGSADVAAELGAQVLRMDANAGFSAANNAAARAAAADVLIFVNPDVSVTAAGVARLARLATERNALVAPQLLNSDGSEQENGRRAPYLYRKLLHFLGRAASQQQYEVVAAEGEVRTVPWVIGAALCMSRDTFERIGGWDAGYFIYYEDSDICLRARAHGFPVLLDGGTRWRHSWARATRRGLSLSSWKHELRSARRFYARYPRLLLHPRLAGRAAVTYCSDDVRQAMLEPVP